MVPPAPDLFSTIADWPQADCRCAASMRPITSVLPPAAAGTIRRTVSVVRQSRNADARKAAVAENARLWTARGGAKELVTSISLPLLRQGRDWPWTGKLTPWRRGDFARQRIQN